MSNIAKPAGESNPSDPFFEVFDAAQYGLDHPDEQYHPNEFDPVFWDYARGYPSDRSADLPTWEERRAANEEWQAKYILEHPDDGEPLDNSLLMAAEEYVERLKATGENPRLVDFLLQLRRFGCNKAACDMYQHDFWWHRHKEKLSRSLEHWI